MIKEPKIYFNRSSEKDASLALYLPKKSGKYFVDKLLTAVNNHHNGVSMHGFRRELLREHVIEIDENFFRDLPSNVGHFMGFWFSDLIPFRRNKNDNKNEGL